MPNQFRPGSTPQLDADAGEFGDPAGNADYPAPAGAVEVTGTDDADASVYAESVDGDAMVGRTAVATGDGDALADTQATAEGDGNAQSISNATAQGGGEATAGLQASSVTGQATTNIGAQVNDDTATALLSLEAHDLDSNHRTRINLVVIAGVAHILLPDVPAADPHVAGALYTASGALKVSAG